jgi:hypothetical protein
MHLGNLAIQLILPKSHFVLRFNLFKIDTLLEQDERHLVLTGVMAPVCSDLENLFLKREMEELRSPLLRFLLANVNHRKLWAYSIREPDSAVWVSVKSPRVGVVACGAFSGLVVRQINSPDEFMIARRPINSQEMKDWLLTFVASTAVWNTIQSDDFWDEELKNRKKTRNSDGKLILDLGSRY